MMAVINALADNSGHLKRLSVGSVSMSKEEIKKFIEMIKINESLRRLELMSVELDAEELEEFCEALTENNFLEELVFNGGEIDDSKAKLIVSMLKKRKKSFRVLSFYGNPLSIDGAKNIVSVVKKQNILEELDFSSTLAAQQYVPLVNPPEEYTPEDYKVCIDDQVAYQNRKIASYMLKALAIDKGFLRRFNGINVNDLIDPSGNCKKS